MRLPENTKAPRPPVTEGRGFVQPARRLAGSGLRFYPTTIDSTRKAALTTNTELCDEQHIRCLESG